MTTQDGRDTLFSGFSRRWVGREGGKLVHQVETVAA